MKVCLSIMYHGVLQGLVELYLHLLLMSQLMEVSGDTHVLPSYRNRACGTNWMGECVAMWLVWVFWRRDRSLLDLPAHSQVTVLTVLSDMDWKMKWKPVLTFILRTFNSAFRFTVLNFPLNRCASLTLSVYILWTEGGEIIKYSEFFANKSDIFQLR